MNEQNKNDKAWEKLFDKYNILDTVNNEGIYEITASQIKEFREPRLMTKFDHRNNLPILFKNNKLSILPITRGSYVIGKMNTYHKFEENRSDIINVQFPDYLQSIDYENITSEAVAINTAYVSGILRDFIGEDHIVPTVNGRMSSSTFSFDILKMNKEGFYSINVENSQVEIDGGYEGIESLTLLEAKNSLADDFLIRQLYYPYRLWKGKIGKKVRPVFLTYSNGIFTLNEYAFTEEGRYNSISLVKEQRYAIQNQEIELLDIVKVYKKVKIAKEPEGIPFPQANSFSRIVNLCELLFEAKYLSKDDITSTYDFNARQTDYYTNAAKYLGLVEKFNTDEGISFRLTTKGREIFKLNIYKRNLEYVQLILEHKAFYLTFKDYIETLSMPSTDKIVEHMKVSKPYNVGTVDTFKRRTGTIKGWINWILDLI